MGHSPVRHGAHYGGRVVTPVLQCLERLSGVLVVFIAGLAVIPRNSQALCVSQAVRLDTGGFGVGRAEVFGDDGLHGESYLIAQNVFIFLQLSAGLRCGEPSMYAPNVFMSTHKTCLSW